MTIHETMDEKIGLAKTYAEDGAFFTAADILADLAETVRRHGDATSPKVIVKRAVADDGATETSARTVIIDGVTWRCWHTGVMRNEWRPDGYPVGAASVSVGDLYRVRVGDDIGSRFANFYRAIEVATKKLKANVAA